MTNISVGKVGTSTFDEEAGKELGILTGEHKTKGMYFVKMGSTIWLVFIGLKYPFVRKVRFDGIVEAT